MSHLHRTSTEHNQLKQRNEFREPTECNLFKRAQKLSKYSNQSTNQFKISNQSNLSNMSNQANMSNLANQSNQLNEFR